MAIVTVKNKYQVVIQMSLRDKIGIHVGDLLEARVERGKVTFSPKSVVDRAIAEGLEDIRKGRVRGPFDTVDEMLASLKGKRSKSAARKTSRVR
jgi:bifunctional DNA-binding transcriptional regulator/antitoxin component of YhaV-PrlF toxin-antitoxin module